MIELSAEKVKELEITIQKVYQDLIDHRNKERKILFNVDNLYDQIRFLTQRLAHWNQARKRQDFRGCCRI